MNNPYIYVYVIVNLKKNFSHVFGSKVQFEGVQALTKSKNKRKKQQRHVICMHEMLQSLGLVGP